MTGSSIFLFSAIALGDGRRSFRFDLAEKIPTLCSQKHISSREFLRLGLFDSQVRAFLLERTDKALPKNLQTAVQGFNGEARGPCDAKHTLAIFTRAPAAAQIHANHLFLPQAIVQLCQPLLLRFADALAGPSQPLEYAASMALPKEDGIVSVTCVPKAHSQRGHQTWFLIPTGKGPLEKVPAREFLAKGQDPEEAMRSWVHAIRKQAGLEPVLFANRSLKKIAKTLALGQSIEHDRTLNSQMQDLAHRANLHLIGEDRAQAASLEELAWLIWNSPRHRDLLLSKAAKLSSLIIHRQEDIWFLLLVFARQRSAAS